MKRITYLLLFVVLILVNGLTGAEQVDRILVNILGAVKTPGKYEVKATEMHLHALIVGAGGPSEHARFGQGVTIVRPEGGQQKRILHKINVHKLIKEGVDSPQNLKIKPGDMVIIMARVH
jgi:protein involved in polysaccharide export with SLBB domain